MKSTLLFPLAFTVMQSFAQFQPPLQSLIDAEKNFAQTAVDKNVKTAFLSNLDENSIVFRNGEPINGQKNWENEEANDNYLFWWPVYADIAASHDLGYTTGPAVFGKSRTEQKAEGGVYYSSVWRKNRVGEWKIATDLGSSTFPADGAHEEIRTYSKSSDAKQNKVDVVKSEKDLLGIDLQYMADLNKARKSFSADFYSPEGRMHRPRVAPMVGLSAIQQYQEENKFEFEQAGGGISQSGDLGYTYGKAKVELMNEGQPQIINANFIRVWKKENGSWKIVFDAIGR